MPEPPGLHGILNLKKPDGWTSHDVVAWVRRTLHQRSVGHAGTLDPMATGVLLVCLGKATRVVEYLMESEKVYRAVARLGEVTDTYDATGQVIASHPVPALSEDDIRQALRPFIGEIHQVPPAYSAIKQGGEAAYRKARRGESVELTPRPVFIRSIELLAWQSPELTIEVTCGAGTYIRSLVHDLGQSVGSGACLTALARLRSGMFSLDQATSLEDLAAAAAAGDAARHLHPLEAALSRLVLVEVDQQMADRLAHGQAIAGPEPADTLNGYARLPDGQVSAILAYRDGLWWPRKVFLSDNQP